MVYCSSDFFSAQILGLLQKNSVLIITGETGSGKTTRIPYYLLVSGLPKEKIIICSQPRRLAAVSVAKRVALEMKVCLGFEVGYTIRFDDCSTEKTRIKFVTDGLLLKDLISFPCLDFCSILVIDEAHERSSNTDLILSLGKSLIQLRPNFKLIITSATLEIEKYSQFFSKCSVFSIPGRCFPIKTFFSTKAKKNFLTDCLDSLGLIMKKSSLGDILIFLTGKDEIDFIGHYLFFFLKTQLNQKNVDIVPVFGGMPWKNQMDFMDFRKKKRKIILATNIAETSLTIPNISFVIDSGFMKQNFFNPTKLSGDLVILPITRINAIQRTGRTGRTKSGTCFRLYTKWSFKKEMKKSFIPELQRIDLSGIILFLKVLGINNFLFFDWIDPPEKFSLLFGFKSLYILKALNKNGEITNSGRKMLEYPVPPKLAKTILLSQKLNCEDPILSMSAMLLIPFESFQLIFSLDKIRSYSSSLSDHIVLEKIFRKWKNSGFSSDWCSYNKVTFKDMKVSKDIKFQLWKIGRKIFSKFSFLSNRKKFREAIFFGFFLNFAVLKREGVYQPIFCKEIIFTRIFPRSILSFSEFLPPLICFNDLYTGTKIFLRITSSVEKIFIKKILLKVFF